MLSICSREFSLDVSALKIEKGKRTHRDHAPTTTGIGIMIVVLEGLASSAVAVEEVGSRDRRVRKEFRQGGARARLGDKLDTFLVPIVVVHFCREGGVGWELFGSVVDGCGVEGEELG